MSQYNCRTSRNYWLLVDAESEEEAIAKAQEADIDEWETSGFDDIEVEPGEPGEEGEEG